MQVSFKPVILHLAIEPEKVYHFQSIHCIRAYNQFSSVVYNHLFSCVLLFGTPCTAACQASLSITNPRSLHKLVSIESVMPSNHLILCRPLLLLPPFLPDPRIRVLLNESTLRMRWTKYWSFRFSISPSKLHPSLVVSILMH